MAIIGKFIANEGGTYIGAIRTMTIDVAAQLVPNQSENKDAPAFRVVSNGAELGAGWRENTSDDRPYVSLKLDDPSFAKPIHAVFFEKPEDGTGVMIWSRAKT